VDEVIPRSDFEAGLRALTAQFAELPPGAARSIKAVMTSKCVPLPPDVEEAAARHFARLWVGDAHWDRVGRRSVPLS
jgi:enoyl-CoA hydratase